MSELLLQFLPNHLIISSRPAGLTAKLPRFS